MGEDSECIHPVRVHGLCACCGKEVKEGDDKLYTILHSNTSVLLHSKEAERINEENYMELSKNRKMVLLLDLDQTVIHTSVSRTFSRHFEELIKLPLRDRISKEEKAIRDVKRVEIDGFTYYVKERDNLRWFLKSASEYFEVHIYTMGNRKYGTAIVNLLDKERKVFGSRIVTRDDNLGSFDKDLSRLFPTNSKNVVILDDRPDVWAFSKNIYPVRPYLFFRTGDINSPGRVLGEKEDEEGEEDGEENADENEECVDVGERTDYLVKKILEECVLTPFDNELKKIMDNLTDIHREFFANDFFLRNPLGVAAILDEKKKIFEGCVVRFFLMSFESEKYFSALFMHYGGAVDVYVTRRTTHIILGNGGRYIGPELGPDIKCVTPDWIHESVFSLKRQDEGKFKCEVAPGACERASDSLFLEDSSSTDTSGLEDSTDSLYHHIVEEVGDR